MRTQYDVIVVGGGSAGIAAALGAARSGADTLLLTDHPFVGGNLVSGLPILGFHEAGGKQVVRGIPQDLVDRLKEIGGTPGHVIGDPVLNSITPVDPVLFRCVINDLLREAGVRVLTHSLVTDAIVENGAVVGVRTYGKDGPRELRAKVTIDASGDGDVAASAGAAYEMGRPGDNQVQSATLMFVLEGVDRPKLVQYLKDNPSEQRAPAECLDQEAFIVVGFWAKVKEAFEAGDFPSPQARAIAITMPQPTQIAINTSRVENLDPTDADQLADAEAEAQSQTLGIWKFFQKYIPGFENSYPVFIAHQIGIRESRRIVGEYMLTTDDLVKGVTFPDSIACGGYDIDVHYPSMEEVPGYHVKTSAYGIPYRTLVPSEVDGLLTAGKIISATHEAFGSTRVMGTTMASGHAAGVAAQLAIESGVAPRDVDITELRTRLRAQGAIVSQEDITD